MTKYVLCLLEFNNMASTHHPPLCRKFTFFSLTLPSILRGKVKGNEKKKREN
jgi:hypothetical protein